MTAQVDHFELMTALVYRASDSNEPYSLLARHFARLRTAHAAFAQERPESWCARVRMPDEAQILEALQGAVHDAQAEGKQGDLRLRLRIQPDGRSAAEAFLLTPMPSYPVRLVLDDRPTRYDEPHMRYKTTRRREYDESRLRQHATLHPSEDPIDPPFDVILFNAAGEVTETTIANIAFRFGGALEEPYLTPRANCGLLQGVMRTELLEAGRIREGSVTIEQVKRAAQAGQLDIICFNAIRGVFSAYMQA
ncbi:hypothetical protein JCM8202_004787 [Rhodotorula sphaerocarpa]